MWCQNYQIFFFILAMGFNAWLKGMLTTDVEERNICRLHTHPGFLIWLLANLAKLNILMPLCLYNVDYIYEAHGSIIPPTFVQFH